MARPWITAIVPLFVGVQAHLFIFIRGEWHLHVKHILFSHAFAFLLLCYTSTQNRDWLSAISESALLSLYYLTGLFSSITIYRLFFHRLRKFPGPKIAATTKFWHVWRGRDSRNFLLLQEMHDKYGDLVRTGPNEITIIRPDAFELLDGFGNTNTRDVWYDILHPRKALVFCRKPEEMRALRQAWSQAVSSKCQKEYAQRIVKLGNDLVDCIASYNEAPVKLNDVMSWFSFDAMGEITFGHDFGMMREKKSKSQLIYQRHVLAFLAPINDATWIAHAGFALFPWLPIIQNWWKSEEFCAAQMKQQMENPSPKPNISRFFISEYHSNAPTHPPAYRLNLLLGNSTTAIVAGSDTTRASLISTWYYLCHHPSHMQLIHDEIRDIDIDDVPALAQLPHLNAVLKEVLRLAPPAMTGAPRLTGPEGLWVGERWVPGGTKVVAPKWGVQRLPSAFVRADEFIPERWTTRPELVLDSRAYAPFSIGAHQCIGKAISQAEMRLATAKLIKMFHIEFSRVHDSEVFVRDMRDQVTMMPGDLFCTFRRRDGGVAAADP